MRGRGRSFSSLSRWPQRTARLRAAIAEVTPARPQLSFVNALLRFGFRRSKTYSVNSRAPVMPNLIPAARLSNRCPRWGARIGLSSIAPQELALSAVCAARTATTLTFQLLAIAPRTPGSLRLLRCRTSCFQFGTVSGFDSGAPTWPRQHSPQNMAPVTASRRKNLCQKIWNRGTGVHGFI